MIQELIKNFIQQNNSITDFLNEMSESYQDGKEVIPLFIEKVKETHYNPGLGNSLAELLQMSDNEDLYTQFELTDIGRLYQSLLRLQETNVDNYIDAGYFEYSVLDNPARAKEIAIAGLEMIRQKSIQLQRLISEIEKARN